MSSVQEPRGTLWCLGLDLPATPDQVAGLLTPAELPEMAVR